MSARQKGLEKKAVNELAKQQKADAEAEKREAEAWNVGAKDKAREKAEEEKELLKRQKAAEKAALEAAEAAELSGIARTGKPTKKKGKDDFDFLKAALANQPKTKAQKELEKKQKEAEERKKKEAEARELKEAKMKAEEEEIKKMAARGIAVNPAEYIFANPVNNRLEEEDYEEVSGLEAAIDVLNVGDDKYDEHPERRQKAAYKAFYEAQLPIMKEELPGLKLSQYKERIFDLWKTSPENPLAVKKR